MHMVIIPVRIFCIYSNFDDNSDSTHARLLNPKALPFHPRSIPMELNLLAKSFVPSLYDSVNFNVTISESYPPLSPLSLNPLALPFISNPGKETDSQTRKSNIYCELHAMDTTPILNSISTPDLSLCGEDFDDDFMCTFNSSCESIILNDSVIVSLCEARSTLNPCAESFVLDDILISSRILSRL